MNKDTKKRKVKSVSLETFIFLAILIGGFVYIANIMGAGIMFKVLMNTAHDLLLNTVFLIMSMAVLAGALSSLLSEFGVISLLNKIFAIFMKPLYGMPGASIAGAITTYLSDNPAIIAFAKDKSFTKYLKDYQVPALCNLGTSFGMGLILTTFMISQGSEFVLPAIIGNVGAIIGSIVSVRIMMRFTKKAYNYKKEEVETIQKEKVKDLREIRDGNTFQRALDAMLEGGKNGVELGIAIIPGVLIVCTLVMILTFGPSTDPLFGFTSPEAIAFPITSLGAVGAAMSLVPQFITDGIVTANDIAVFTAMGMCWSGYLSTHVGMMDALDARHLTGKAIISHTIGGICAGISAHFIFMLLI